MSNTAMLLKYSVTVTPFYTEKKWQKWGWKEDRDIVHYNSWKILHKFKMNHGLSWVKFMKNRGKKILWRFRQTWKLVNPIVVAI